MLKDGPRYLQWSPLGLLLAGLTLTSFQRAEAFRFESPRLELITPHCFSEEKGALLTITATTPYPGSASQYKVFWPTAVLTERLPYTIEAGMEFEILRCLASGEIVSVGRGNVESSAGSLAFGKVDVLRKEAPDVEATLAKVGNLYPRPMAGDVLVPVRKSIATLPRITPKVELDVEKIFERTGDNEYSFDLSTSGKTILAANIEKFRGLKTRFLIEAYSQVPGLRYEIRQDTQIRAQEIAKYLKARLNVGDAFVISLGTGNDTLAQSNPENFEKPTHKYESGIVIRAVNY